jgi:hypothetical protein
VRLLGAHGHACFNDLIIAEGGGGGQTGEGGVTFDVAGYSPGSLGLMETGVLASGGSQRLGAFSVLPQQAGEGFNGLGTGPWRQP